MQGVVRIFDPHHGRGHRRRATPTAPSSCFAPDALEGSLFQMLRQGQRVNFELDADGRAITCASGPRSTWASPPPRSRPPRLAGRRTVRRHRRSRGTSLALVGSAVTPRSRPIPRSRGGARRGARAGPHPNARLLAWVDEIVELCRAGRVHWFDGSDAEHELLCKQLVDAGTFTELDPAKRPGSYWAHSDPSDVARVEDRTFICSEREDDAGPTNNWKAPAEMRAKLDELFRGCMRGRTMYVVPFSMGPLGSPLSYIGVEITDSPYVAVSMRIMTRAGQAALDVLGDDGEFVPVRALGRRAARAAARPTSPWPCNPDEKWIVHFPETREIWSYGSGYGGNALLGKKCFALRIASVIARDEGWLAEHMLILKLTSPEGHGALHRRRVPVGVRQDQPRHAHPDDPGLEGRDHRRRHRVDEVRRRRPPARDQPRVRVLRRGARHQRELATRTRCTRWTRNTVFTNTALTDDGDVWWEDMTDEPPAHLTDWQGQDVDARVRRPPAAHPNSRFCVPGVAVPVDRPRVGGPEGRADLGVPVRRPARHHRPARVRVARLAARRVRRRDHGLGEDRRRHRRARRAAPRPVRDAAVLRLPHGRLLRALAER